MSRLFVVSTPIGNLGDMSARGVEALRDATRVLAEDTRRTGILLKHFGVETPMVSLHAHNEEARVATVLEVMEREGDVALVSDAGTPLLSDPGARLVSAVLGAGHEVVPIPGASAILAALVASGLAPEPFTFYGFIERSGKRRDERLGELCAATHTTIVFESPNRLARLLADLESKCGGERRAAVARELTKLHETIRRGTLAQLRAYYEDAEVRGEVVVVLGGREARGDDDAEAQDAARELALALLERGERASAVAREVARRLDLPRNAVYELVQRLAAGADED